MKRDFVCISFKIAINLILLKIFNHHFHAKTVLYPCKKFMPPFRQAYAALILRFLLFLPNFRRPFCQISSHICNKTLPIILQ
jgi:hypothetical protein